MGFNSAFKGLNIKTVRYLWMIMYNIHHERQNEILLAVINSIVLILLFKT